MKGLTTVLMMVVMLIGIAVVGQACGGGPPSEAVAAERESKRAATEQFDEARKESDADYERVMDAIEAQFAKDVAYADKAITSEAKQLRMKQAEEVRVSAIEEAKQAQAKRMEEAAQERARVISTAEAQTHAVVSEIKFKQFILDKGIQLEELQDEYCVKDRILDLAEHVVAKNLHTDPSGSEIPPAQITAEEYDPYETEWRAWKKAFLSPYVREQSESRQPLEDIRLLARDTLGNEYEVSRLIFPKCKPIWDVSAGRMDVSESEYAQFDISGVPRLDYR